MFLCGTTIACLWSLQLSGGAPLTFLQFLFYSFDTLVAVEYGARWAFRQPFLNFMRNWNKHFKPADRPDMAGEKLSIDCVLHFVPGRYNFTKLS